MGVLANNLYTSTGNPAAGSGGRSAVLRNEYDLIEQGFYKRRFELISLWFPDLNTAGSYAVPWTFSYDGIITRILCTVQAANATNPTVLTAFVGGTPITHATWQILAAAVAFDTVSTSPTSNHSVSGGVGLKVTSDGAGTTVMPGMITFEVTIS